MLVLFTLFRQRLYRAAIRNVRVHLLVKLSCFIRRCSFTRCPTYRSGLVWSGLSTTPTFSYFSVHRVLTPDQVCVVLNNKGVRVCTVCKSPYKASVRLPGGESISLFQSPLPPPYICFMVVTRHQNNEVRCARFCEE